MSTTSIRKVQTSATLLIPSSTSQLTGSHALMSSAINSQYNNSKISITTAIAISTFLCFIIGFYLKFDFRYRTIMNTKMFSLYLFKANRIKKERFCLQIQTM